MIFSIRPFDIWVLLAWHIPVWCFQGKPLYYHDTTTLAPWIILKDLWGKMECGLMRDGVLGVFTWCFIRFPVLILTLIVRCPKPHRGFAPPHLWRPITNSTHPSDRLKESLLVPLVLWHWSPEVLAGYNTFCFDSRKTSSKDCFSWGRDVNKLNLHLRNRKKLTILSA